MKKLLLLLFLLLAIGTACAAQDNTICSGQTAKFNFSFTSASGGYYKINVAPNWASADQEYLTIAPGNTKTVIVTASPQADLIGRFDIKATAVSAADKLEESARLTVSGCYDSNLSPASKTVEFCGNDEAKQPLLIENKGQSENKYFMRIIDSPIWVVLDTKELAIPAKSKGQFNLYMWPAYDVAGNFPIKIEVKSEKGGLVMQSSITAKVKKCYAASLFEEKPVKSNKTSATLPALNLPKVNIPWYYWVIAPLAVLILILTWRFRLLSSLAKWANQDEGRVSPHYKFKKDQKVEEKYDIERPDPPKFKPKTFKTEEERIAKLREYKDKCLDEGFTKKDVKALLLEEGWAKRIIKIAMRRQSIFSKFSSWFEESEEEPKKELHKEPKIPEEKTKKIERQPKKSLLSKLSGWLEDDDDEEPKRQVAEKKTKPAEPKKASLASKFKSWLEEDEEEPSQQKQESKKSPKKPKKPTEKKKMEKGDKKSLLDKMNDWVNEDE